MNLSTNHTLTIDRFGNNAIISLLVVAIFGTVLDTRSLFFIAVVIRSKLRQVKVFLLNADTREVFGVLIEELNWVSSPISINATRLLEIKYNFKGLCSVFKANLQSNTKNELCPDQLYIRHYMAGTQF